MRGVPARSVHALYLEAASHGVDLYTVRGTTGSMLGVYYPPGQRQRFESRLRAVKEELLEILLKADSCPVADALASEARANRRGATA